MQIIVPVSAGELLDKISILRIKNLRIANPAKLLNVRHELRALENVIDAIPVSNGLIDEWLDQLVIINVQLWEIEDDIRGCEANDDFGPRFIELARSVYRTNDLRAKLKREINEESGSILVEEKSYADPDGDSPGVA